MRPEELSGVIYNTVMREVKNMRYSGSFSLHFDLICLEGGIRDCAVSMQKKLDIAAIEKGQIEKDKKIS